MLARAGIIGSTGVGSLHADALRRIGVTLAGVAAVSQDLAQRDAERLGATCSYPSADDLISSDEIDVVHVCTPNALHFPQCRAALAAGKHVVAEKPLATSAQDAEELLRLAEGARVVHALCHTYRYYPMVQALRELVARGELGRVHAVHGTWLAEELLTIETGHWMLDPERMGPSLALADVGVHLLDLVEHVSGRAITDVSCDVHAARPTAGAGEDTAAFVMRLAGGTVGTAMVCQAAAGHANTVTLELIGDRASASWDIRSPELITVRDLGGPQRLLERATAPARALGAVGRLPAGHPEGHSDALREMLARVYDHVSAGAGNADHPTFADGVRGLRMLEALRQSTHDHSWTAVEAGLGS